MIPKQLDTYRDIELTGAWLANMRRSDVPVETGQASEVTAQTRLKRALEK